MRNRRRLTPQEQANERGWGRLKPPERVQDWSAWAEELHAAMQRCPDAYAGLGAAERAEKRRDRLLGSGLSIPAHAEDKILSGRLEDSLAMRETRAFMDGRDAFLLLSGPTGRGKTLACGYVVAEHGGHAVTGPELVRLHAAAGFDRGAQQRKELYYDCRVLVLDELARGDELVKHEKTAVFGLLNARQGRGKRTLITTNRKPLELNKRYENVSFNRVLEQGKVVLLEGEPDLRLEYIHRRAREQP